MLKPRFLDQISDRSRVNILPHQVKWPDKAAYHALKDLIGHIGNSEGDMLAQFTLLLEEITCRGRHIK